MNAEKGLCMNNEKQELICEHCLRSLHQHQTYICVGGHKFCDDACRDFFATARLAEREAQAPSPSFNQVELRLGLSAPELV